jgi:tetratricopeptide (TPR) repeat protein
MALRAGVAYFPAMQLSVDQLIQRGREAFERRDYVAALADFRRVLEQHAQFADIRHLAGLCLSFLGQPEAALGEFERAIAVNDRYAEAHLNRAITLSELGRYDEASEAFRRAKEVELTGPTDFPRAVSARLANAHATVADLYVEAGAPAAAASQYVAALRLRPEFADIRNRLGQVLLDLGDLDAAQQEFQTALEANERFMAARVNLGLAHYRKGDVERAREIWEQCRGQQPGNPQVRAFLAMLNRPQAAATDASPPF